MVALAVVKRMSPADEPTVLVEATVMLELVPSVDTVTPFVPLAFWLNVTLPLEPVDVWMDSELLVKVLEATTLPLAVIERLPPAVI